MAERELCTPYIKLLLSGEIYSKLHLIIKSVAEGEEPLLEERKWAQQVLPALEHYGWETPAEEREKIRRKSDVTG